MMGLDDTSKIYYGSVSGFEEGNDEENLTEQDEIQPTNDLNSN